VPSNTKQVETVKSVGLYLLRMISLQLAVDLKKEGKVRAIHY
jgi:hypothetical protein